jgi:hypothetical protein
MDFHLEVFPSVMILIIVLIAVIVLALVIVKRKWINDAIGHFKSNAYVITAACTIILSLSAFLISVYLIYCCGYCRSEPCCNSDSIVVAAFGILVTLLVGWQIYKTVDVDKKIEDKLEKQGKKVKNIEEKFENNLKNECLDAVSRIFTVRSKNIDRIEYSNELYFFINEAQFYFLLKKYTTSYEKYLSALYYLYKLNENDYFKYDNEISTLLDMLFEHKDKIQISQIRKDSDINLIKTINNNEGLIKYVDIISNLLIIS